MSSCDCQLFPLWAPGQAARLLSQACPSQRQPLETSPRGARVCSPDLDEAWSEGFSPPGGELHSMRLSHRALRPGCRPDVVMAGESPASPELRKPTWVHAPQR